MGYPMDHEENPRPLRRGMKISEAMRMYPIGKTKLYELIKSGRLRTVKIGRSRIIPTDEIEALFRGTSES